MQSFMRVIKVVNNNNNSYYYYYYYYYYLVSITGSTWQLRKSTWRLLQGCQVHPVTTTYIPQLTRRPHNSREINTSDSICENRLTWLFTERFCVKVWPLPNDDCKICDTCDNGYIMRGSTTLYEALDRLHAVDTARLAFLSSVTMKDVRP